MEKELAKWLALCEQWQAIVLMDEVWSAILDSAFQFQNRPMDPEN